MKRKIFLIGLPLLLIIGIFFAAPSLTRNHTSSTAMVIDLLNPRISNSILYVKTSADYEESFIDDANGQENFTYLTVGYDQHGVSRKILYTSFGRKMTPDKYLKLLIKGQNVRTFEEVQPESIPEKAFDQLN
ncbi:YxeA family protein [Vagococcus sp. BWB3-3]|uniref:YxeA family protein n=1 Tax=Vagococcus allomyrinae TaxID=2794353 RepID=A0A940P6R2_9ENTE|nr:YxeA family protein [Vagococcus allomyrinae]MBP1040771.1 YxeA family protein [Vagococcus allomyrinae]